MAVWPPQESVLSEHEKESYRSLLYYAMLDIRDLCQPREAESRIPWKWRKQYRLSRIAGALADWLHNLALYAARDFRGFDADWFWREYDALRQRFPQIGPGTERDYRERYEHELSRHDPA